MISKSKKRVYISLTHDTLKKLETSATKFDVTKSDIIESAVLEYLRKGHEIPN